MRTLILTLALSLLALGAFAQDVPPEEPTSYGLAGGTWDSDVGWNIGLGGATPIQGNLVSINRAAAGEYGSVETDLAYFVLNKDLKFAFTAGPNADWTGLSGDDPVMYFLGAGGAIIGYMPGSIGGFVGAKYKFAFDGDALYKDGWQIGAYLAFGL